MPDKIVNHFVLADGSVAKYDAEQLAGDVPEVADIRTGFDGTVYPSAGDAVRGQATELKEDIDGFIENNNIISGNGVKVVNVPSAGLTNTVINTDATEYPLNGATTFIGTLTCDDEQITNLVYRLGEYRSDNTLISATDVTPNEYYTFNSATSYVVVRFKITTTNYNGTDNVVYQWGAFQGEKRFFNTELFMHSSNVYGLDTAIDEVISETFGDGVIDFYPFDDVNGITNGTSYIQDNIVTQNGFQFCCFVNSNNKVVAGKRTLVDGSQWEFAEVSTFPVDIKQDNHYTLSMGIDEEGAIHIAGGMHCSPMRYVRSANPYDISNFVRFAHMVSDDDTETYVSYPQFVKKQDGGLLFFYRAGNNPYQYIVNTFVAQPNNHHWARLSSNLISGDNETGYPYINHIARDKLGRIHVSGCWRTTENKDIFYMYNDDNGSPTCWKKTDGSAYSLPVTMDNCETIQTISNTDNGLLNQNGMSCDNENNPHIVYFKVDGNDYTNLFHLYLKNGAWHNEQITNYSYKVPTNLTSYEGQISRPSICCYGGRTFVLYRHNYMDQAGKLLLLDITDFPATTQCVLFDANFTAYDIVYDTNAVDTYGKLYMLVANTTTSINESVSESIRYDEVKSWDSQLGGVLTVNLKQVDTALQNKIRLPMLKTVASSSEKIIIPYTALRKYVRAVVQRTSTSNSKTHLLLTSEDGTQTEVGTICMYQTDSNLIKSSPYIPIDLNLNENVVFSYSNDNENVDAVNLEYAVLDY